MDAFKMMAEYRITGVAIVQEDGTLFTIISAKDIKVTLDKLV
jgi:CBS domain-containing protein